MNSKFVNKNGLHETTTVNLESTEISALVNSHLKQHVSSYDANRYAGIVDRLHLTSHLLAAPTSLDVALKDALPALGSKVRRHLVTLGVLISPRFYDGTSVRSYSDPGFDGGTVLLGQASGSEPPKKDPEEKRQSLGVQALL
jgi:hypothetical protein